jgi:hypothetical protein
VFTLEVVLGKSMSLSSTTLARRALFITSILALAGSGLGVIGIVKGNVAGMEAPLVRRGCLCGRCRQRRFYASLICHRQVLQPFPVASLRAAVRFSTLLAGRIPTIGGKPLRSSGRRTTRGATVALTTVATHTNSERRTTDRIAADLQSESRIRVCTCLRHAGLFY